MKTWVLDSALVGKESHVYMGLVRAVCCLCARRNSLFEVAGMKILLISLSTTPVHSRHVRLLASRLANRMHEVFVFLSSSCNVEGISDQVQVYRVAKTQRPRIELQTFNVPALWRAIRLMWKLRPDVVHVLSPHPWNVTLLLYARAPTVVTLHDPVPHPGEGISAWVEVYNRVIIRLAKAIVLHGMAYKDYVLRQRGEAGNVFVVPLGEVEAPPIVPDAAEMRDVLMFGRIRPYKGVHIFIRAVSLLKERYPQFRFVIAGEGDLSPYKEELEKVGGIVVDNRVIPEHEMGEYFARARLVVLPYTSATQSGIIPLAYAYRRPVVATSVGSIPEMVIDGVTGILVPPNDHVAVAKAIERLATDEQLLRRMAESAYEVYVSRYDPDIMADRLDKCYRMVIKEKGRDIDEDADSADDWWLGQRLAAGADTGGSQEPVYK